MKKLAIALTTVALLATGIGAASAQSTAGTSSAYASIGSCSALSGNSENWSTVGISDKLKAEGVSYSSIDTFGNCFSVMQTNADGTTSLELYDPATLNRINL